jgi:hypothetical protein
MTVTRKSRERKLLIAMLFVVSALSWTTVDANGIPNNPAPYVVSLSPLAAAPGGAQFTLTLNGTHFIASSTAYWNSTALTTTFVSATKLTATIPAPLIAASGTGWVTVRNPTPGGGTSNITFLPVGNSSSGLNFATFRLTAASGVLGVAPGDFDEDGDLDLVTANWSADSLSIFLSNGDGTFQAATNTSLVSTSARPIGVSVGDLNNDGHQDLVVGFQSSTGIAVLLGNGNGTFQTPVASVAGSNTYESVLGDFNGDGRLDVATTNYGQSQIHVLLGNGDGTFQSAVTYAANSGAFFFREADLDGDGSLDLVAGNYNGGGMSVLMGNSDGTFDAQQIYTAGTAAADVAIGDFNGDNKMDLVATSLTGNNMYLLAGNGDGTFQAAQAFSVGFATEVVAAGDFNADGTLDLAVVKNSGGIGALLGNGDGTFQTSQSFAGASFTYGITLGNFNSGGGIGIATTDFNTGELNVLLQTVSLSPATAAFGNQPIGVASSAHDFTVTNSTSQNVTLTSITFTGTNAGDFQQTTDCGATLNSGASCTVHATFTPGAAGARSGVLNINDDAPGSPQTATVSGTGVAAPVVSLSAAGIVFPNTNVGVTSAQQSVTLSNTGNATLNITSITTSGSNAANFNVTNTCGSSVAASATCSIDATFTPSATGAKSATVTLVDDAADSPQTVSLSGQGQLAPTATLSAASLTFSSQLTGSTSAAQSVTLTNNGNATLGITSIALTGTDAADFAVTDTCGSAVAAADSCTIGVTFTPSAADLRYAAVTIVDSASGSPHSISLQGTGEDFSLTLSAGTATVVAGNSASVQLSVAPLGGLNQTIALSCAGAPTMGSCTVTPASITPSGSPVDVTVAITTTGHLGAAPRGNPPSAPRLGPISDALLVLVCLTLVLQGTFARGVSPGMRWRPAVVLGGLLVAAGIFAAGCATTSPATPSAPSTPAGTYNVTVSATAGSLTRSAVVSVIVQ